MSRPLKYLEGSPISTIAEFDAIIRAGHYLINRNTKQRIHPGWAGSWQYRIAANTVRRGVLLRAIPNPKHPDNKETQ